MQDQEWNRTPVDANNVMNFAMKTIGIVIVIIGVVFLFSVTKQVWEMFDNPEAVKDFSLRLEKESGIDKFTNSFIIELLDKKEGPKNPNQNEKPNNQPKGAIPIQPLHISYFAAWFFKIILLIVIVRIALWMIREGGIIARKEKENKALVSNIAREMCSNIFREMENQRNQR